MDDWVFEVLGVLGAIILVVSALTGYDTYTATETYVEKVEIVSGEDVIDTAEYEGNDVRISFSQTPREMGAASVYVLNDSLDWQKDLEHDQRSIRISPVFPTEEVDGLEVIIVDGSNRPVSQFRVHASKRNVSRELIEL